MDYLRSRFQSQRLSEEASKLLLASWREKTSKSYDSLFGKWLGWCNERGSNPISRDISEVVNFLAYLFEQGYQYRSLNSYRSAISSVHEKVDGYECCDKVDQGCFPSKTTSAKILRNLGCIHLLTIHGQLSMNDLTCKTVMLMALTRPARSADLTSLSLYSPEGVTFAPTKLAKQSSLGPQALLC